MGYPVLDRTPKKDTYAFDSLSTRDGKGWVVTPIPRHLSQNHACIGRKDSCRIIKLHAFDINVFEALM